ncbi:MAG: RimK family alpha-L-glutamate ligase [Desulfobacteraceae bacterium]
MQPPFTPHLYFIALGSRLRGVPEVRTLGVRPNFQDYTQEEREEILNASLVLYPTRNYAQFLTTMGRPIFPSLETYLYADEKILQSTLFQMLGINHPLTRFYYPLHHHRILEDFSFPFVAKLPRASSRGRGVFLVEKPADLWNYLDRTKVAYIQEFLPHNRDLRVVLINYDPVLAYWRKAAPGSFKTNLSQGGSPDFDGIPEDILAFASECAWKCRFNDVGLDFIYCHGRWYLIEANMMYGRKGLSLRGMDLKEIIRGKLVNGKITP